MTSYKLGFRLNAAKTSDYERLFRELKTELIAKLRSLEMVSQYDPGRGVEYLYVGGGSLQEVTAASYLASHNVGKESSFTIIRQKGPVKVITMEKELI
jgi:hypothetical protein